MKLYPFILNLLNIYYIYTAVLVFYSIYIGKKLLRYIILESTWNGTAPPLPVVKSKLQCGKIPLIGSYIL